MVTQEIWLLADVLAEPDMVEVVQCALLEAGAFGLETVEAQSQNAATFSVDVDPDLPVHVLGYFPEAIEQNDICNMVQEFVSNAGFTTEICCTFRTVTSTDYQQAFKESFKSIQIGKGLFIVPSWEEDDFTAPDPDAIVIYLDPEMAFGTGQHETTQLCSERLVALLSEPGHLFRTGLDLGTGTGILAILMKKLGLDRVVGLDTDPEAIRAASENAEKNTTVLTLACIDEQEDYGQGQYDVVVANIFAHTLIERAKEIVQCAREKGHILLSGILDTQVQEVLDAFLKWPVVHVATHRQGEWALLEFQKRS